MKEFVSGLPSRDLRPEKSFEQVLEESRQAIIKRRLSDQRRQLYSASMTQAVKQTTKRMIGESDD